MALPLRQSGGVSRAKGRVVCQKLSEALHPICFASLSRGWACRSVGAFLVRDEGFEVGKEFEGNLETLDNDGVLDP